MKCQTKLNIWFLDNLLLSELRLAPPLSWELEKEEKNLGVELIFYSKNKVFKKCYERDDGNYFSGKAGNEVEEANKGHRVGKFQKVDLRLERVSIFLVSA